MNRSFKKSFCRAFGMRSVLGAAVLIVAGVSAVLAQSPAHWKLEAQKVERSLAAGEKIAVKVVAEIDAGWHLYALDQPKGGPVATTIEVAEGSPFKLSGEVVSPRPITKFDPNFKIETKFFDSNAVFEIPLEAVSDADISSLVFKIRFQLCNDTICIPPKTVRLTVAGVEDFKKQAPTPATVDQPTSVGPAGTESLWGFIWLAVSLGALSLLTPCVFPMIPITVSYFTSHAGDNRAKSVKLALVYSVGIIATFTIVGMLLAVLVGAAGINLFAANPWVNLLITGIFLFFALNLFGAYEIGMPAAVVNRLDALTRSKEGEGSGIAGALLMGLTFTLTSFTCTSPFVGTILVSASQGSWKMPLAGMVAFSSVFALPFFVLALAPQLLSQLPRAGGWMNSVKVSMGFLEVAAAMKFISNVDLVWGWGLFTRDVVLAVWIAIGVVLAFYLLGRFQLHHDSKPERIGAVRLMFAVASLAMSFYLLTGLFGSKLGELESFLPPDLGKMKASAAGTETDPSVWMKDDLDGALKRAKAENKKVFIDFTGYTCTNCRWMEANVFPKSEVAAELDKFVKVQLFTDGIGEVYERQQKYQEETFKTVALPFYAVLDADGKVLSTFPGLTRDVGKFTSFLQKAQTR